MTPRVSVCLGAAVGLVSAAGIAYQIVLMRILSIAQWHHFAYMVISLAMLGFGASGALLALLRQSFAGRERLMLWWSALAFCAAVPASYAISQHVPFETFELATQRGQMLHLLTLYLVLSVPFFLVSTCITCAFLLASRSVGALYAWNMAGSGVGALVAVGLLYVAAPPDWPVLGSVTGMGMAAWILLGLDKPAALSRRPLAGCLLFIPAALMILAAHTPVRVSQYKGFSYVMDFPDAEVLARRFSPLSTVTAVRSVMIRETPGEITAYPMSELGPLPEQIGLFFDAGSVSPVNRFDGGLSAFAYLDYVTGAVAYRLVDAPDVFVLGPGGGTEVLAALYHGARHVTAVEVDPAALELVRSTFSDFAGGLYQRPDVTLVLGEGRGYLQSHDRQFDLIQAPLSGSFTAAASGVYALNESYLYTVEAFRLFLRRLTPEGVLAVTCWLKTPPRDSLKLFATAVEALRRDGIADPGKHLVMIRSLNSATLVVSRAPLSGEDVAAVRGFCQSRSFDPCYFPGVREDETNQYIQLSQGTVYYQATQALVSENPEDFYEHYLFYVRPATDMRPYFFRFFKWSTLPRLVKGMGVAWVPFVEWGYVALAATIVQAAVASAIFILAPLAVLGRSPAAKGFKRWVIVYFALLGIAYMFLEIVFVQRFMLFLAYPVYAVAVVLTSFLFFSGAGSYAAGRLAGNPARNVARAVLGIACVAGVYHVALHPVFEALAGFPDGVKIVLSVAGLAPMAFCMGIPFPLGLQAAANRSDALLPWAWGINGCASVMGATLATASSVHMGFPLVVLLALVCYGLAALAIRPLTRAG
ncbi:MAG TPA: SAM-dependent methyltransferase [Candidatus Hydrogenedentes bacterium]|mgnify:CR=1 FL=1|nr:SAM-dependent methyltransferase [Candidatus Hydrogenedentota bacterium]